MVTQCLADMRINTSVVWAFYVDLFACFKLHIKFYGKHRMRLPRICIYMYMVDSNESGTLR